MTISATTQGIKPGVCTSTNRPSAPFDGQVIYMTDVDQTAVWDGTAWTVLAPIAGGRNAVINGNMNVWQRGTSISVPNNSYSYYAIDRWHLTCGAVSGNAWTVSRQPTNDTTNLPNLQYCARVQRNSGQTNTNGSSLGTFVETVNAITLANKPVTLSFYARASATYSATSNILTSTIYTGTGTDQNNITGTYTGEISTNVNYTLTTTWQRFSTTMTMPANMSEIHLRFLAPVTGTAGAADYYEITGVQLEAGAVATPFEFEDYGTTLQKCLRYYQKSWADDVVPGTSAQVAGLLFAGSYNAASQGNSIGQVTFQEPFRAAPTVTIYSYNPSTAGSVSNVQGTSLAANSGIAQFITSKSANIYNNSGGSITPNLGGYLFHFVASAEL